MRFYTATFTINGTEVPPPVDWNKLQLLARYDNDDIEATVDTDEFRIVNQGAEIIRNALAAYGSLQGLPYTMTFTSITSGRSVTVNGYIDLKTYKFLAPNDVIVKIGRLDTVKELESKLQGISFMLLKERGLITAADYTTVPYVVEKEFNEADFAILSVTTYLMFKETRENLMRISQRVTELTSALSMVPPQPQSAALKIALLLAIDIVYFAFMITALVKLMKEIVEVLYPVRRNHKGMTLYKMLERMIAATGYTFSSPIPELSHVVFIPSKPEIISTRRNIFRRDREGIPSPQDYGYICSEFSDGVKTAFNARYRIDEQKKHVELRTLNDPFWLQQTGFVMEDHLDEIIEDNARDIVQTRLVTFARDSSDFWTVESYEGTAFEITTEYITPPPNPEYRTLTGFEDIRIPWARGVRKDTFSVLEEVLRQTLKGIDAVVKFMGGGSNFASLIENRAGLLKQGTRYHAVPKLVYLEGSRIPQDYLDHLSARALYTTYICEKSLVADNFFNQKKIFPDRRRYMNLDGFIEASKNKFFDIKGLNQKAEFTLIKYGMDSDTCVASYKVRHKHTPNLKETFIEPA